MIIQRITFSVTFFEGQCFIYNKISNRLHDICQPRQLRNVIRTNKAEFITCSKMGKRIEAEADLQKKVLGYGNSWNW